MLKGEGLFYGRELWIDNQKIVFVIGSDDDGVKLRRKMLSTFGIEINLMKIVRLSYLARKLHKRIYFPFFSFISFVPFSFLSLYILFSLLFHFIIILFVLCIFWFFFTQYLDTRLIDNTFSLYLPSPRSFLLLLLLLLLLHFSYIIICYIFIFFVCFVQVTSSC